MKLNVAQCASTNCRASASANAQMADVPHIARHVSQYIRAITTLRIARRINGGARSPADATAFGINAMLLITCVLIHASTVGESDPVVLEFDHIEQNSKERNVSILIRKGCALERLQREISRCEVRCAGCHRRRTSVQLGWNLARYRHEAR